VTISPCTPIRCPRCCANGPRSEYNLHLGRRKYHESNKIWPISSNSAVMKTYSSTGSITVRTQSSVCDFLKLTSLRYRPSIGVSQTYRNINTDVSHRQRNVIYSVRARIGLWEPCPLCGTGAETLVRVWGFAPKVNRTFFCENILLCHSFINDICIHCLHVLVSKEKMLCPLYLRDRWLI